MKNMLLAAVLILSATALSANINRLVSGSCGNGRTWWCNTEFNNNGVPVCMMGMGCDGNTYNTCPSGPPPSGGVTSVTVSGGILYITVTSGPAQVTVHDSATGVNQVYDFGTVSSASVSTSTLGTGNFTIVTHSTSIQGLITDAVMITI